MENNNQGWGVPPPNPHMPQHPHENLLNPKTQTLMTVGK